MQRLIYLLCFAVALVGCSTNTQITSTNDLTPQYIDESKYEGDELGIVMTLNNMVKALYEKDFNTYNSLITGNMNPAKGEFNFKKYFISIDKLDFTVNPDPSPPDGAIPVVLDYTGLIYDYNVPEKDKQLFVFEFEDETWKLVYIADWW